MKGVGGYFDGFVRYFDSLARDNTLLWVLLGLIGVVIYIVFF